jgi:hypothetical protein
MPPLEWAGRFLIYLFISSARSLAALLESRVRHDISRIAERTTSAASQTAASRLSVLIRVPTASRE